MSSDIGARVREKLIGRGLLQKDVAEAVGMSPDALSRSISGDRSFSARELAELADLLDTSIDWLVTGERGRFEPRLAARHTWNAELAEHEKHNWVEAKKVVADPLLAYTQARLKAHTTLPPPSGNPVQAATACRARLEEACGADFVTDLPHAIESTFGIDVFVLPGRPVAPGIVEAPTQGAYAAAADGQVFIVVGVGGEWYRKNFSLSHELGHILARHLDYIDERRDAGAHERWANLFAAELLLPSARIKAIDWAHADGRDVAAFLAESGASTEALGNRLRSLRLDLPGYLAQGTPTLVRAALGDAAYDQLADTYLQPRFPQRLVDAQAELVQSGLLPPYTLAWMLGVRPEDLVAETQTEEVAEDLAARTASEQRHADELAGLLGLA